MLDHLGHTEAAHRVTKAISTYVAEHPAGTAFPPTVAVGDAIAERL
jgi:isocitrate/isopropylmalate dehydrogenase